MVMCLLLLPVSVFVFKIDSVCMSMCWILEEQNVFLIL